MCCLNWEKSSGIQAHDLREGTRLQLVSLLLVHPQWPLAVPALSRPQQLTLKNINAFVTINVPMSAQMNQPRTNPNDEML